MRSIISILISLASLLLFSCEQDKCAGGAEISSISVDIAIERLDQALFTAQSPEEMRALLNQHPLYLSQYANLTGTEKDSLYYQEYFRVMHDPHIDTLYQQTQAVFENVATLETDFAQAFRHIKYYYPDFTPPKIYTTFTGLGSMGPDLLVSDSLIVISLDFFAGPDARYRPQVYDYLMDRYSPGYIVPSCIMILSNRFNNTKPSDNSLLAEMVYYGKSYYFVQQVMPCLPDTILAGYDEEQITTIQDNTEMIWSHFIDNELLYETSHIVKPRYVGERPSTVEINTKIPGRVGRWIGWQIVQNFADKTEKQLPQVMQEADAQQIFTQAKYRP
ncbi:MAG: gliding motility lipoprotein GldB [Cyclobacteriaceae bacterium]